MDLILADSTKFSKALDKLIKIVEGIATDPSSVDFGRIPKVLEQFEEINGRWAELEDWVSIHEPNSYQALEELGLLYYDTREWSKAIASLQKACDLVGRVPGALLSDPGRAWRSLGFALYAHWLENVDA